MDMVDFQEKMDPTHRASLCRMLRTKQLPECLLTEYLKAKKMVDVIDGSLTVGELAIIALMAGYNPDTGKFEQTLMEKAKPVGETTEEKDAPLQAEADKTAVEQPVEQTADQAEHADDQADKQPVDDSEKKLAEQTVTTGNDSIWALGMPVTVLHEDSWNQGTIVNILPPEAGSDKMLQLTVEFEGGKTVTVDEDEVEAV